TEQQVAGAQLFLDALEGLQETRIGGGQQSELGQQQRRGVDVAIAESRSEALALLAPRAFEDFLAHEFGACTPVARGDVVADAASDAREAVAARPGNGRGKGVALQLAAELPGARVRLLERG